MSGIVSVADIGDALGEVVPADEESQVQSLIHQAVAAVEGYLHPAVIPSPTPHAVRAVVERMVVRSLKSEDGGVWMNKQDKQMLRPFRRRGGIVSVPYRLG